MLLSFKWFNFLIRVTLNWCPDKTRKYHRNKTAFVAYSPDKRKHSVFLRNDWHSTRKFSQALWMTQRFGSGCCLSVDGRIQSDENKRLRELLCWPFRCPPRRCRQLLLHRRSECVGYLFSCLEQSDVCCRWRHEEPTRIICIHILAGIQLTSTQRVETRMIFSVCR